MIITIMIIIIVLLLILVGFGAAYDLGKAHARGALLMQCVDGSIAQSELTLFNVSGKQRFERHSYYYRKHMIPALDELLTGNVRRVLIEKKDDGFDLYVERLEMPEFGAAATPVSKFTFEEVMGKKIRWCDGSIGVVFGGSSHAVLTEWQNGLVTGFGDVANIIEIIEDKKSSVVRRATRKGD